MTFEYKAIKLGKVELSESQTAITIDDHKYYCVSDFEYVLNAMGARGWELVTVVDSQPETIAYFMRRIMPLDRGGWKA